MTPPAPPPVPTPAPPIAPPADAFDALAADYDARFTDRPVGRYLRRTVWRHAAPHVAPGTRVLDLGCGTGEDALWLARRGARVVALDRSAAMVARARAKLARAGLGDRVHLARWDAAELASWPGAAPFDVALANFGVLNCIDDPAALASAVADRLRPGGRWLPTVMGPWCAWEVAWYLARGDARRALRRARVGGATAIVGGGAITVRYPGPRALAAAAAPGFAPVRTAAVGVLLPPTYAAGWLERRPRLLDAVARLERAVAGWPAAVALADHYLLELVRRPAAGA